MAPLVEMLSELFNVSYVKVWTMGGFVSSLVIFHVCSIPLVINLRCDSYFLTLPYQSVKPSSTISYCVEAKYSQSFPELTFVGHRGPFGKCAGDCDGDSE